MCLAPTNAAAVAPTKTGWWTQGQQGGVTGSRYLPYDKAPDAGDFHVGNAGCGGQTTGCADLPNPANDTYPVGTGPTEISAVAYGLPAGGLPPGTDPGTQIADLNLQVHGQPVGTNFKLLACRVLRVWAPVNGGDWSQRPAYQQGGCAPGKPSTDGKTVGFTLVAALAGRQYLELALVPAFGDPTPYRVQFKSDDPAALTYKPLPPSHTALQQPIPQSVEAYNSAVVAEGGSYPAPAAGPELTAPVGAPPAQAGTGLTVGGTRGRAATGVVPVTDQRLILLLLAAILLMFATNWSAPARRLLSFDKAAVRGVGRFVRERSAQAQPL
jgi:hypothetical protein